MRNVRPRKISNRQIVDELIRGDKLGYKHLSDQYKQRMLREAVSVYKIRIADAEEIVNDIMLVAVARIQSFRFRKSDDDFRLWLITILRNRIRDHIRKRGNHNVLPLENALRLSADPSVDGEMEIFLSIFRGRIRKKKVEENDRMLRLLHSVLETMEPWEQILLRLRALAVPYVEISTYTTKSASQLKVYHARVKKKLRRRLEEIDPVLFKRRG